MSEPMVEEKSWQEFRSAGLLWWCNRILHLFGWALVVEVHQEGESAGHAKRVYPARCKFRGFDEQTETEGFRALTKHMEESLPRLKEDLEA